MIDDLPPPLGPHSATTSPGATWSERPRSTGCSGRSAYRKLTLLSLRSPRHDAGAAAAAGGGGRISGSRAIHFITLSAAPTACASAV